MDLYTELEIWDKEVRVAIFSTEVLGDMPIYDHNENPLVFTNMFVQRADSQNIVLRKEAITGEVSYFAATNPNAPDEIEKFKIQVTLNVVKFNLASIWDEFDGNIVHVYRYSTTESQGPPVQNEKQ